MENYIYELGKKNGVRKLEIALEEAYPQVKVMITTLPSQRDLRLAITDRCFHLIAAYNLTDFDCKRVEQCFLPQGLNKLPKSEKTCDDETIRKFYLRFMKNEFETYYEDYKAHQLKLVDKDLDCETAV